MSSSSLAFLTLIGLLATRHPYPLTLAIVASVFVLILPVCIAVAIRGRSRRLAMTFVVISAIAVAAATINDLSFGYHWRLTDPFASEEERLRPLAYNPYWWSVVRIVVGAFVLSCILTLAIGCLLKCRRKHTDRA